MKKNIFKSLAVAAAALVVTTSCEESLSFGPIDYYGSESYWKSPAHVQSFAVGLHSHFRGQAFQHLTVFGELRSGIYRADLASDGNVPYYNELINNILTQTNPGVSKFGNLFGCITNCNLLITRLGEIDFMTEEEKAPYYALGHGLRAFYYFELHRIYGGVPIRTTIDVIEGERDVTKLYLARDTPKNVLDQVKSDINKSLEYYGSNSSFNPYGLGADKGYWSKAASEALAADIYLWSGKVATPWNGEGGTTPNPADLTIAKTHLNNLLNNYGLAMLATQTQLFDINNKYNSETIFAMRYAEGEATNNNYNYLYNMVTGVTKAKFDVNGNLWGDQLNLNGSTGNWYEYDTTFWKAYDPADKRRDLNFVTSYDAQLDDNGQPILNAEGKLTTLWGTHCKKNLGYMNSQGNQVYCGDIPYYRLPWVYLGLAEIANYEGDNANVEKYMNLVRDRAFGEGVNDYVASDFATNELAILHERDFEFVQEGQRWWDLRRMTSTKDGDPMVFSPEAAYKPFPVLNKATQSHMILWPVDKPLMDNDELIKQTPGYEE